MPFAEQFKQISIGILCQVLQCQPVFIHSLHLQHYYYFGKTHDIKVKRGHVQSSSSNLLWKNQSQIALHWKQSIKICLVLHENQNPICRPKPTSLQCSQTSHSNLQESFYFWVSNSWQIVLLETLGWIAWIGKLYHNLRWLWFNLPLFAYVQLKRDIIINKTPLAIPGTKVWVSINPKGMPHLRTKCNRYLIHRPCLHSHCYHFWATETRSVRIT